MSNPVTVVGSVDGMPPIYNPSGFNTTRNRAQVWFGTHGNGRVVANVGDELYDIEAGKRYIVIAVDEITLIPTLKEFNYAIQEGGVDEDEDKLLSSGPGKPSETFRVYIDQSVMPHELSVDSRCYLYGRDLARYELCVANKENGEMRVISAHYDQSGNYLGTSVPLELASMRDHSNFATWAIPTCNTAEELQDGDVVYLRAYAQNGGLRSEYSLLVENSSFIRLTDKDIKYITSITLETPFLSSSNPNLIEYPLNMNLNALNLFGVVHYSDGSRKRMPVDGTKFQIFGFRNFVSTIVGERSELILQYNLDNDEVHYGSTNTGLIRAMQQNYEAVTTKEDGSYTVKLFCYPVWVNAVSGYRLEFFLYNLDRNTAEKVTPYVTFNTNGMTFNPRQYGINQQISVTLNLNKVNPAYKNWNHVQVFDITLNREATDKSSTPWSIGFERTQTSLFGDDNWVNVKYLDGDLKELDVSLGLTDQNLWLERLFYRTLPLYAPSKESKAPTPNMFSIVTRSGEFEFPIAQWRNKLSIVSNLSTEETIYIKFFRRNNDNDLHLAIAGIPIIFTNARP